MHTPRGTDVFTTRAGIDAPSKCLAGLGSITLILWNDVKQNNNFQLHKSDPCNTSYSDLAVAYRLTICLEDYESTRHA